MDKIFAPEYQRTQEGWVIFGRDTELRRRLFPNTDPAEHVAKANMLMVKALVEYMSDEADTILDPFGGTGTILVACTINRAVIMIELVEFFCNTIETNARSMKADNPEMDWNLIPGNASAILPIPDICDHMIFSPPYPMGLKKSEAASEDQTTKDLGYGNAAVYSEGGQENFTTMSDFIYHRKIEAFYKKCFKSIRAGGTMSVIIKDRMEKGVRQLQADRTTRDLQRMGFELVARNKWLARGGGFSAINRAAGLDTVDNEDLITVRVP